MVGAILFSTLLAAGLSWFPVLIRQEGTVSENVAVFQPNQMVTLGQANLVDFVIRQPWGFRMRRADLKERVLHLEMEAPDYTRARLFGEIDRVIDHVFAKTHNIDDVRLFVDERGQRILIEAKRSDWRQYSNKKKGYGSVEEYVRKAFQVTEFPYGS